MKHIKVVEKDSWIHITEAKKFESLLVGALRLLPPGPRGPGGWPPWLPLHGGEALHPVPRDS